MATRIPEPLPILIPPTAAAACREAAMRLEVVQMIFTEHQCHEKGWDQRDFRGFDLSIIAEQLVVVQHILLKAAELEDVDQDDADPDDAEAV
jgi:hypothetical protein